MADRSGYIGRAPGDSSVIIARQTFEPTGIQTDFTFASGYTPGHLDVYLNGSRLIVASDYTATDGSVVGLTTNALNGDVLECVAYKAFNLGSINNAAGNFTVGVDLTVDGTTQSSSKDTGAIICEGGVGIEKNLFVGGGAEVTGILTVTNTLDANGALDVDGHTELDDVNVSGASTFTGAADFNGAIDVDGHTELDDVNVSGAITATTFTGNLTGTAGGLSGSPNITINNLVGVAATFSGVVTYEDVTNVDSVGIITARSGIEFGAAGVGGTITSVGNAEFAGICTATSFKGDGSGLSGVGGDTDITSCLFI